MSSKQQAHYLQLRSDGASVILASVKSGLPIGEAHLIEKDIARGEVSLPAPTSPQLPIPAAGPAATAEGAVMAKKTKPGDHVTNLSETKDIIRNAVPEIVNLKEERKAINEQIAAIRERVNAAGIPKKALDHAIKIREMDPEDRQRFDEGYAIVRDVIGVSMSRSLFDMLDTPTKPAPANTDATADAAA